MEKTSKGKSCWYGYLNAGKRSSPVLRDDLLVSGNSKTIYMYNLNRDEIIEYALEIVEKKLRDLKADESEYVNVLDAGYRKARRDFKVRGAGKRKTIDFVNDLPRELETSSDNDSYNKDDSDMWSERLEA